eukprot:CAMPEP_0202912762 /NCGR_PEP_ID=MMETSP1392-20130828/58585_1 /ASSEMBLY_ACC=CAM_ASM_000868 /TAXON_ID=225041 /ORGANISM="Chlamydomonas chlamydogama, Strain SAG 11-48b" /LENGTH=66 /DNA_ID=CAMNT_0049603779 /DNA_START=83 /DNA_END=283 /DNA_ORIENTATION=-
MATAKQLSAAMSWWHATVMASSWASPGTRWYRGRPSGAQVTGDQDSPGKGFRLSFSAAACSGLRAR